MVRSFISAKPFSIDAGLLLLRVVVGLTMLTHGWPKLSGFSQSVNTFPDPFGLGATLSLSLTVLAEFFCSLLLIAGLFTRVALIPLMITMLTVVLIIHGSDPFGDKELPVLYLTAYTVIFFAGPGKFSVDAWRK